MQRGLRERCDAHLLYACILPSIESTEFFLQVGIGLALRERAYTALDEVVAFCAEYRVRLAPLTRREAMRVLKLRGAQVA